MAALALLEVTDNVTETGHLIGVGARAAVVEKEAATATVDGVAMTSEIETRSGIVAGGMATETPTGTGALLWFREGPVLLTESTRRRNDGKMYEHQMYRRVHRGGGTRTWIVDMEDMEEETRSRTPIWRGMFWLYYTSIFIDTNYLEPQSRCSKRY